MTEEEVRSKMFSGVGPSKESKVFIIQYADGTIFFCKAKAREVRNLMFVWQLFEWVSGLNINRSKSELLYIGRRVSRGARRAALRGCRVGRFPIRYLGLSLTNKGVGRKEWWNIISKFEERIDG